MVRATLRAMMTRLKNEKMKNKSAFIATLTKPITVNTGLTSRPLVHPTNYVPAPRCPPPPSQLQSRNSKRPGTQQKKRKSLRNKKEALKKRNLTASKRLFAVYHQTSPRTYFGRAYRPGL